MCSGPYRVPEHPIRYCDDPGGDGCCRRAVHHFVHKLYDGSIRHGYLCQQCTDEFCELDGGLGPPQPWPPPVVPCTVLAGCSTSWFFLPPGWCIPVVSMCCAQHKQTSRHTEKTGSAWPTTVPRMSTTCATAAWDRESCTRSSTGSRAMTPWSAPVPAPWRKLGPAIARGPRTSCKPKAGA